MKELGKQKLALEKKIQRHYAKAEGFTFSKEHFLEAQQERFLADSQKDQLQLLTLKIQKLLEEKEGILSDPFF